jgi:DNA repair protein RadC
MKLKNLPKFDLPREKLEKYGSQKLKDYELLAILLGSGIQGLNVLELSKRVLKIVIKMGQNKITFVDLLKIKGLGKAKALQIIALFELSRRFYVGRKEEILSPEDVWKLCLDIRESKKEHFIVFYLDTQNHVIERQIISIGTLNTSLVHPREVFESAVRLSSASIIVAHNHPSGSLDPSNEDRDVTRRLVEAGEILGIEVTDHIITTREGYFSFKDKNMLK